MERIEHTFGNQIADEQGLVTVACRKAGYHSVRRVSSEFAGRTQGLGTNAHFGKDVDFFSVFRDISLRFPYMKLREPSVPRKLESEQPSHLAELVVRVIASECFQPVYGKRGFTLP